MLWNAWIITRALIHHGAPCPAFLPKKPTRSRGSDRHVFIIMTGLNRIKIRIKKRLCVMRAPILSFLACALVSLPLTRAAPSYFASVANQALRLRGGASFGPDLSVQAVGALEQQVKRVLGDDPALPLNVSSLRDRSDPELLRVLLLAVLGNFTSGASSPWERPCELVVDPQTGLVALEDAPALASLAQKVVLMLLVAVQFKQWVEDVRARWRVKGQ